MRNTSFLTAVVTEPPVYLDLKKSLKKAIGLMEEAAKNGAKLIVFGESWLPGYPYWVWLRSQPDQVELTLRMYYDSLTLDSAETQELCQAAREHNIHVVMGITEREGEKLYSSLLFVNNEGEIPLCHRKVRLTGPETMIWEPGTTGTMTVVPTELSDLGGQLSWEHTMPGNADLLADQGEQVHIAAYPGFSLGLDYSLGQGANAALAQAYALRNQSFVIAASTAVTQEIVNLVCRTDRDRELFATGGGYANVFEPNGAPLIFEETSGSGMFYAVINPKLIKYANMIWEPAQQKEVVQRNPLEDLELPL
ncbi:nitrilase-related carbon-nitrogen hydrolase [Tumebacillus flagellatus]|uniref:CN hydrolase domain-containing protein n=1 Tax=Tumebacillus flagellatus TaxID=1157490 RepID=A0A074LGH0_9BACL|nr:nitrilase-related carbon-nitrogen hydrolase [Tumebacillus flagellatus]KEO81331.1 hypothetical protein EL26_21500 [Tumebacillus flagellatus]